MVEPDRSRGQEGGPRDGRRGTPRDEDAAPPGLRLALVFALLLFALLQFRHLSHPLLWNDEAYTAVFAERVLEYGYPKVHGTRNVVYGVDVPLDVAVKESNDAYLGSPWGQYYAATLSLVAARAADDPHAKTALLRLPFTVFGCLGLFFVAAAFVPLIATRRAQVGAALAFVVACAASTSLQLTSESSATTRSSFCWAA